MIRLRGRAVGLHPIRFGPVAVLHLDADVFGRELAELLGDGGDVLVESREIVLQGDGTGAPSISSSTDGSGTGGSLTLTGRDLQMRSGGRLSVESSPGAGCCFTVMLPRAEAAAALKQAGRP